MLRVLALSVTCACTVAAQSTSDRLAAYLSARAQLGQFNGTVLVAQGGRVLFEQGYGLADVAFGVPATAATRYEVASITKMFTAAAILRLQEAGAVSTAAPMCSYLADCPDAWRAITVSQLLHHTSGVPDYEASLELGSPAYVDYMLPSRSADRILRDARGKPLDFAPGTQFSYSNTGYILLSAIIERLSGRSYREYVREQVLTPAGMRSSTFVDRDSIVPNMAGGYRRGIDGLAEIAAGMRLDARTLVREPLLPLDGAHGDAALITTARDLWHWTEALAASTALKPASIREMFLPGLGAYGTGWFIGARYGRKTASHTGALPGYPSMIEWYPDSRTTIVVLSNVVGMRLSRVMRDLAAITFGQPYDVPTAHVFVAFDSVSAAPLAGTYALEDGKLAHVTVDKEMLAVAIPGRFTAGALPLGGDVFYAPMFENTIRFERTADGAGRRIVLQVDGTPLAGVRR